VASGESPQTQAAIASRLREIDARVFQWVPEGNSVHTLWSDGDIAIYSPLEVIEHEAEEDL
jgi:hypothetical protein